MGKSLKVLAAVLMLFSLHALAQADDAGPEYSFQPDTTGASSLAGTQFAASSRSQHMDASMDQTVSVFDDSKAFVQLYAGYDYSFLQDLVNGTNAWINYGKSLNEGYTATGGGNNSGIMGGAMFGLRLDKSNSLALDLCGVSTFANNWTLNNSTGSNSQVMTPDLLSVSLDYILDIVRDHGSHTYLTLGAGYYHTDVTDTISGTGIASSGTFTGDTIGGTLGLGEEVHLGGPFSLDFSVRGRYASFSQVSSNTASPYGGGTNPSSLAIYTVGPGYQVLIPVSNAGIASSNGMARYATVDYSGIDAKVGLNIYF